MTGTPTAQHQCGGLGIARNSWPLRLAYALAQLLHDRVGWLFYVVDLADMVGDLGHQLVLGVCLRLPTAGVTSVLSAVLESHSVRLRSDSRVLPDSWMAPETVLVSTGDGQDADGLGRAKERRCV